jgi:hypothetical protein
VSRQNHDSGVESPAWYSCAELVQGTYEMIPPIATKTPNTALSPTARPEVIQPRATIEHVFTWPTTVLDTGPVWAIMKNCDILIMHANSPD